MTQKKTILAQTLLLILFYFSTSVANDSFPPGFHPSLTNSNSNWNLATKTLTITSNVIFGGDEDIEEFHWEVPEIISRIVIDEGVTVTGGFLVTNALIIEGKNRDTSKIFGTNTKEWKIGRVQDGWRYPLINAKKIPEGDELLIRNLTLQNSRTFNILSKDSKIVVDLCNIINTRENDEKSNNDGFTGGPGSVIKNSFLAVNDDVIKVYSKNMHVENVTILMHSPNSVPFQMGWDDNPDPESSATLKNVLVKGAARSLVRGRICGGDTFFSRPTYNKGVFVWKGGSSKQIRTITLDGFKVTGLENTFMYSDICKGFVPMPLSNLWRMNGKLILKGKNVFISVPQGSYPNGETVAEICGLNSEAVKNSYKCGVDKVNGDGIH